MTRAAGFLASLAVCVFVAPLPALADLDPPLSETVLVTATLSPEEEAEIGAATTVIDRQDIEDSGAVSVLDLLRDVPGLDVVRSGSDGAVTSVFVRGANSTQALVLVDGVRMNSPYFSGYDFGALTAENVERVEVVRGPFSSLYGSDAMGGVIQIFTRPIGSSPALSASLESGTAGQGGGTVFVSSGAGPIGVTATYRGQSSDGDRPNSNWDQNNGSLRVETANGPRFRAALEGAILDGKSGSPGPVGGETPLAQSTFREERVSLPVDFSVAEGQDSTLILGYVKSAPTYRDPNDPFFGATDTDARTLQARGTHHWKAGTQSFTALASWERSTVTSTGSFGTPLDGDRASIWALAFQDGLSIGTRANAAIGVRADNHSQFGNAVSPRVSGAWRTKDERWKVRASAGEAFRAPSVGELYYPFFGNLDLQPERSRSYEAGTERYFGKKGRAEVSIFRTDFRDLIVYDFTTGTNQNIGHAQTKGVELAWRQQPIDSLTFDIGYTRLKAENTDTGDALLRRPRNRAFGSVSFHPVSRLLTTVRANWVGSRPDVNPVPPYQTIESPSYFRLDLYARYDLRRFAPYVRVDNVTDESYAEAAGFPAPDLRVAVGVEFRLGDHSTRSGN